MSNNVISVHSREEWDLQHAEAAKESKAVIVDFFAEWCGPCKMVGPFFGTLSTKYPNSVYLKIDVDEVPDVAEECEISGMPTFQVFKDGEKVDEFTGAFKDKLEQMVAKYNDDE